MSMSDELRYVRPNEYVTDFRTPITGITPATFYREGVISEDEAGHEVTCDITALQFCI